MKPSGTKASGLSLFKGLRSPSEHYPHFNQSLPETTDYPESDEALLTPNRRQERRYDVEEGALVVYDRRTDREIGFVKDLGPGGLSFEYFDVGAPVIEQGEFGLLVLDSNYYIGKIPYRIVSDFELETEDHSPIPIRHCSVHFDNPNREKSREIEAFIGMFSGQGIH
ncbi:hypothetical protein D3OALGA1CA_2445 [Olavius algarvensis associated proteobacterium Delta 3]|nr:hypothetical protein D3OALGA1CA_2445 [Olavius algarvensis associated proteobacterium Delta 3]CAB5155312.1 hypothetical protein D3OALGB2SA_5066 [Olavius algarvensis associated proteobacterium Delta 3]